MLLLGEAGIGKTALARRLAERAAREGTAVIQVVGRAVSSGVPFEAFAGVLTGEESPGPAPGGSGQVTAADVAARAAAAADGARLLVVVDDVDLLDDGSARVLLHLASAGALVVATARAAPLPGLVEALWRDGHCERIELAGLTDDEAGELLETVLGAPADLAATAAFVRRAQGNPLLLRELVQTALQRSVLVRPGPAWVLAGEPPLSGGVRDLAAARLAGTGEAERAALETVAAGEPLPAEVALAVVGESVLIALEEARLITVRPGLAGSEVSTAHPLYGEVLRADLPVLRLRRLRLALAGALESAGQPGPHDLVRAASWRLDSGQGDDPQRLLAAARAARAISLETAERLARHAHESHRSLPATLLLAEILTHTGRGGDAAAVLAGLPPDSLTPADREALTYCAAFGQGLQSGDTSGGAELVAALATGDPAASRYLQALHASMLTFDARLNDGLVIGLPIMIDRQLPPETRAIAALAAVGAEYWLGHTLDAVAHADELAAVTTTPAAAGGSLRGRVDRAHRHLRPARAGPPRPGRAAQRPDAPRCRRDPRPVRRAAGRILSRPGGPGPREGRDRRAAAAALPGRYQPVRPVHRPAPELDAGPRRGHRRRSRHREGRAGGRCGAAADEALRAGMGAGRSRGPGR